MNSKIHVIKRLTLKNERYIEDSANTYDAISSYAFRNYDCEIRDSYAYFHWKQSLYLCKIGITSAYTRTYLLLLLLLLKVAENN